MRRVIKGFTLLEILIVVIIVGILAALAIPYYIKTAESSKAAEAYANLGVIRKAVWVYYSRYGHFVAGGVTSIGSPQDLSYLNIEDPNTMPTSQRSFQYSVLATSDYFTFVGAGRIDGPYYNQYIWMDLNGNINEDDWLQ